MKIYYDNRRDNINDKWIIYEIYTDDLNIKIFKDPNYINGYYIIDNIPNNIIKVIDKEK